MSRVKNIQRVGNNFVITYTDCEVEEIPICCEDETPPSDNPGDWPPPVENSETRCRVALFLGDAAVDRINDFLNGLNLSDGSLNFYEAYSVNRISVYGWPISLYGNVLNFEYTLFEGALEHDPGRGLDAKNEYTANPSGVLFNVQEDLYCVLGDNGDFSQVVRNAWIARLALRGTAFYQVLGDFLALWPLDQLREIAFNGSVTTDPVDCETFDCEGGGGGGGTWCYTWDFVEAYGGWTIRQAGTGVYQVGVGWKQSTSTTVDSVQLLAPAAVANAAKVTQITVEFAPTMTSNQRRAFLITPDINGLPETSSVQITGESSLSHTWSGLSIIFPPVLGVGIDPVYGGTQAVSERPPFAIKRITMHGEGDNPFADEDNCE